MKKLTELVKEVLTENQLVKDFKKWIGKDKTPTSADIDYYTKKHKLTPDQKAVLKKAFPSDDIKIKSTGPTPDTRFRNK